MRSVTSLVQIIGRAARNVNGKVVMYADDVTRSMEQAISETNRRRDIQEAYNVEHGITPTTIFKEVRDVIDTDAGDGGTAPKRAAKLPDLVEDDILDLQYSERSDEELKKLENRLTREMRQAAKSMAYEEAATLRDLLIALKGEMAERSRKGDKR